MQQAIQDGIVEKFTDEGDDLVSIGVEGGRYYIETVGMKTLDPKMAGKRTRTFTADKEQAERVFAKNSESFARVLAFRRKE